MKKWFVTLTFLFSVFSFADTKCPTDSPFLKTKFKLEDIIGTLDYDNCKELQVGESRMLNVDSSYGSSTMQMEAKYRLKRLSEKKYQVEFAPLFQGPFAEGMYRNVQLCLNLFNRMMKTKDGDELELKIIPPEVASQDKNLKKIIVPIRIDPPESRSASRSYAVDIRCVSIVHELLHLTGMPDEYTGQIDGFKCRSVGADDSIMGNHYAMLKNLNIQGDLHISLCECDQRDQKKGVRQPKYSYLPPHFLGFPANHLVREPEYENQASLGLDRTYTETPKKALMVGCPSQCQVRKEIFHESNEQTYGYYRKQQYESMGSADSKETFILDVKLLNRKVQQTVFGLKPAHFRHITTPFCSQKNKLYYGCAAWAYDRGGCEPIPPECKNKDWTN